MTGHTWRWRLENAAGDAVTPDGRGPSVTSDGGGPSGTSAGRAALDASGSGEDFTFPTQSDAESWIGEEWQDLLAAGVVAVFLLDGDRQVYGPMSLLPPD